MTRKFFALTVLWAFALCFSSAASAQTRVRAANQPNNRQLVNLLPASDGAASINMRRLLTDSLPQILSGNQPLLADVLRQIDDLKTKTGIDLRQFEQIAVGVSGKQNAARKMNFEPVVLARGTFNANSLIELARAAGRGKYREERLGDRTIYIFTAKNAVRQNNSPAARTSVLLPGLGLIVSGDWLTALSNEFAVSQLDADTVAIGTTARVRETLGTNAPRLGGAVLAAIDRKPDAAIRFAVKLPAGLSSFFKLSNDELGNTLDSIRLVSGVMDTADDGALVSLTAKTLKIEQAESLQTQLEGFQILGRSFLGGAKGADKQLYARLIENVKINREADEVMLDLQVPQSDINFLLNQFNRSSKDAATFAK